MTRDIVVFGVSFPIKISNISERSKDYFRIVEIPKNADDVTHINDTFAKNIRDGKRQC